MVFKIFPVCSWHQVSGYIAAIFCQDVFSCSPEHKEAPAMCGLELLKRGTEEISLSIS